MGEQFVIRYVPCRGGGGVVMLRFAHTICVKFRLKRVYDSICSLLLDQATHKVLS